MTTPADTGPAPASPDSPARPILQAVDVARSYGETRALVACTVELAPGEVHAVIGENGSGKSTFVKILSGVISPDAGVLHVNGSELRRIASPRVARKLGIATVFQEVMVVDPISVLENVWLGTDSEFRTLVPLAEKRERAAAVLAELMTSPPKLDAPAELLDLASRQVCVIARALVQEPRVIILDEPTSALDVSTRDRLFEAVERLCVRGAAVVYISHRMDEIEQMGDRVTVLRSGVSVATLERRETNPSELLRLMSGEETVRAARAHVSRPAAAGNVVLSLRDVSLQRTALPIAMELRAGEIVGVAGLEGHGQERFIRVLAGIERPAAGEVVRLADGSSHTLHSQRAAARLGVAYVPRDRKTEGVFEPLSILDNFSLPTIRNDRTLFGLLADRRRRRRMRAYVDRLRIKLASPRHRITTLSGGNQQKVIIARWLAMKPDVLILNDPTRGVDAGTKGDIYDLLGELAASGVAVVMLSTEIEEHLALMDRVLVFREGHLFAEIPRRTLTRDRLIAAFFGRHHEEAAAT